MGSARPLGSWWHALTHQLGLDKAIVYTAAARILQGAGSVGTVLILVRFLTPAEQGYYYTFWSIVALQAIFEMGFSFVILQTAAHERANVQIREDGSIDGAQQTQDRLARVLQMALRWYFAAAVIMGLTLLCGGAHFFAWHATSTGVAWQWPLRVTVLACCATFAIGPVVSFLEGSGMVTDVARMRFAQSLVSTGLAWGVMMTHHGLYSPAMVLAGQGVVALSLIIRRWHYLFPLLRRKNCAYALCWHREVWPFQWKIAVSWICDYFIFQLFTPVLFAFRGPVEAGRMGLSMSAVTQLGGVVLVWMSTKAAPFGMLVARGERKSLDRVFFRTLWQSLSVYVAGASVLMFVVVVLPFVSPQLSQRIVSWQVFVILLLTGASNHLVQSLALYLRAHKVEPFFVQSIVVAGVTTTLVLLVARTYGTNGIACAYCLALGLGGLCSASGIFMRRRAAWSPEWYAAKRTTDAVVERSFWTRSKGTRSGS